MKIIIPFFSKKEKRNETLYKRLFPIMHFWSEPQVGTPESSPSKVTVLITQAESEAKTVLQP